MSGDIVERLRRISGGSSVVDLARDAAAEVERLRAAGDALVNALERRGYSLFSDEAIMAWEAACRE